MVEHSMRRIFALASVLAVTSVTTALADDGCGPLADITHQLAAGKYHEAPIAHAIASSGALLIVFAAPDGATWTLVGVRPDRPEIGCLLAAGKDWITTAATLPGRPS